MSGPLHSRGARVAAAWLLAALFAFTAGKSVHADCDPASATRESDAIRRLLEDQARRARYWNVGWGIGFGVAAAGQLTFALKPGWAPLDIDKDTRAGLYVSASKASIGAGSRLLLPLRVERAPEVTGDPCRDAAAARRALAVTAQRQRRNFWLNHIGSLAVNLGGALVLGFGYDAWGSAGLSVAVGYPVGLVSTYTMPRGAWRGERRLRKSGSLARRLRFAPIVTSSYRGAAISLRF